MDALKQALTEDLGGTPSVSVFGLFQVPESVVVTWIIMAALVLASVLLTRRLRRVPGKAQTVLEMGVSFLNDFCKENLGEHWRPFAPWIGTVALYITAANLSGLFGLAPPTRDLTITAALALMSMALIYGGQFRCRGLKGGLKKFAEPSPVLLPINLMEVAIRPLSLCMRLFGNVLASFVIMEMIKVMAPAIVPIPFSLYFDVFDGLIQTLVFVFLTTLFLGEAIQDE
ncbi:F0F1 ATP synthase subunit A [Pseudoflavonifractor phocaeensis]|uniref:F0F1 ATP synthase subunit A n=1 Tax=Pseudoflavonifractor phocaeensis TaxID=1870988 RepID=UPI00313AE40E